MLVRETQYQFQGSKVLARVQGTEPEPSFPIPDPFSDEQWGYVIETMSQRATLRLPFSVHGKWSVAISFTLADISKCSCPDKANPCKHIGDLLPAGRSLQRRPVLLFQLRGRTKDQIIAALPTGLLALKPNLETPDIQEKTPNTQSKIDSF